MIDRRLTPGRHVIEAFLRRVAPYHTVVDLGTGMGADLRTARRICPDASLHGIDVSAAAAARLRDHGIESHVMDIERGRLPFGDESVDVVIANQLLEHTKELFWILHQVTRVLRTGGSLVIGVPNLASLHNRVLLLIGQQPSCIQPHTAHVRGFTRPGLLKLIRAGFPEGYKLLASGGSNFYPFPPVIARPLARAVPSLAVGLFVLLSKERQYRREYLQYLRDHRLQSNFYVGPSPE